jgi:hypothetical protein
VFRIVDLEGEFLNEGSKWLKKTSSGELRPMTTNPTNDAITDVKNLKAYVAGRGLPEPPVFAAIAFTKNHPVVNLTVKDPTVPASQLEYLQSRLQPNFLAKDRLEPRAVDALVKILFKH